MSTLSVFLVIAGGTAMAAKIESNSVKSKSIKDNAIQSKDLKDGAAVGTTDVIDNSLTGTDIDESKLTLPASPSSLPPSGSAGGGLTGDYPNPTIATNAVGTAQIVDNAVNSATVGLDSLAAVDLAPDSVGASEIAANGVGQAEIATNGVGPDELAANSVTADELDTISVVTNSDAIANGATNDVVATCPGNSEVISGGAQAGNFGVEMATSRPLNNGWQYQARNTSGASSTITVFALCIAGG